MNSAIDFGLPSRPPMTRNWFDGLLLKFSITPFHVRKYMRNEVYVKESVEDIAKICRNIGLRCSVKVDWENEHVSFRRFDMIAQTYRCCRVPFNEFLSDDFNPQTFVYRSLITRDMQKTQSGRW